MIDGSKRQKERKRGIKGGEKKRCHNQIVFVHEMDQEEYVLLLNEEFQVRAGTNVSNYMLLVYDE